jgi:6-phosphogluconolactonase
MNALARDGVAVVRGARNRFRRSGAQGAPRKTWGACRIFEYWVARALTSFRTRCTGWRVLFTAKGAEMRATRLVWLTSAMILLGCAQDPDNSVAPARAGTTQMLYVGGEGNITWYKLDEGKGELEKKGSITYPLAATFFAKSANNKIFYGLLRTINEMQAMTDMKALEGFVATYTVDQASGELKEIARRSSEGDRPTYIILDKTGKFALVANNLGHLKGNSIVVFPVGNDGVLGEPVFKIQMTGIRAHQVRIDPSNKYVYVPNIDSDTVSQFSFDEKTGKLTPLDPATASVDMMFGPRHLDFHPNGKWVYLSNEYKAMTVPFEIQGNGTLKHMGDAVFGLPQSYDPMARRWQSEIRVAPSGKYVYAGERVHESLAIFAVDPNSGSLTLKKNVETLGKTPRNFALTQDGKWLVVGNQESSSLVLFKVTGDGGDLEKTQGPIDQPFPYVHLFVTLP